MWHPATLAIFADMVVDFTIQRKSRGPTGIRSQPEDLGWTDICRRSGKVRNKGRRKEIRPLLCSLSSFVNKYVRERSSRISHVCGTNEGFEDLARQAVNSCWLVFRIRQAIL